MKKTIRILSIASVLVSIACFFLPFLIFEKYKPLIGIKLITTVFKRIELVAKLSANEQQTYVFTSSSVPLMAVFIFNLITLGLIIYNISKNSKRIYSFAVASSAVGTLFYGIQLSHSETSMADFFGTLLVSMKSGDGTAIFKRTDMLVETGLGARALVLFSFISLALVVILKVLDIIEKRTDNIQTPWTMAIKQFKRNKLSILGLVIMAVLVIICFYGPVFSKYSLLKTDILIAKEKPSFEHFFGTDSSGRDLMTRLMYGGRISITVGFVAVMLEVLIGIIIGGMAGYYGGKIDNFLMRVVDIFLSLPYLPVVIICGAIMSDLDIDPQKRIFFVMLIIGLLGWPVLARLIRGQILSLREQEYMIAAEALGLKDRHKIMRHLIPNVIPSIIVAATLGIGDAILSESALSFLGLGVAMPFPSWGNIIQAVREPNDFAMRTWLWIPSGICIFTTVLAINFVGDGLRDAFDPKMKK